MTALYVAAVGGHLQQLHLLRSRLRPVDEAILWVTWDAAQSRSLLADEEKVFIRRVDPRDVRGVVGNMPAAHRLLRDHDVSRVVSTGAGISLSFLPLAAAHRVPAHYIESATRVTGPSLSGRLLRNVPGVRLYTQYPSWAGGRWCFRGSLFDDYLPVADGDPRPLARVLVALGTMERFGFRRLVERLVAVLPPEVSVTWQTGSTDVSGLPIDARSTMPVSEFQSALRDADVVVAHAGTGTALAALEAGKLPLLVPRRKAYGEHVDDHQVPTAAELERRGLAVMRDASVVSLTDLEQVSGRRVEKVADPAPFLLDERT